MSKTKRDRDAEKRNRAVARKRDIQALYVQLREGLKLRNGELLAGTKHLEGQINLLKTRHASFYKDTLFLIQQCEQRILDYTYALDNQEPPFAGNGLQAVELIEKATSMLEVLSHSLFKPVEPPAPEKSAPVEDTTSPVELEVESEDSEDDEDPTLDTLDTI